MSEQELLGLGIALVMLVSGTVLIGTALWLSWR